MKYLITSLLIIQLSFSSLFSQQLAFPGAEGFGRFAKGGRGGKVVEVTNLNDSGTGSLRYAIESSYGPRTIVFKVGGIISLLKSLQLKDDAFVTIAGQTAPGDGICIKNYPLIISRCHDVILRFFRSRLGDAGDDDDALWIPNSDNVIVDHCSLSWSVDAIFDVTHQSSHVTAQWNILSEALLNSHHEKGAHSMGTGWDGKYGCSYHHNLIANCNSRTPRLDKYAADDGTRDDLIDIINNVIYNWDGYGAYGGENADVNWIGNYYKYGPSTSFSIRSQIFKPDGDCMVYVADNYVDSYPLVTADNTKGIRPSKALSLVLTTTPYETDKPAIESATDAFESVLTYAGAILPIRDEVDSRIIDEVKNRKGKIIDSQSEVGGWPVYNNGVPKLDSDKDGMPDEWETANGLDINDSSDRNNDIKGDGYTNLEYYLNGLVSEIIATPISIKAERELNVSSIYSAATNKIIVNISTTKAEIVTIELVDLCGRKTVLASHKKVYPGTNEISIDVAPLLKNTLQLLKIALGETTICKKMIF